MYVAKYPTAGVRDRLAVEAETDGTGISIDEITGEVQHDSPTNQQASRGPRAPRSGCTEMSVAHTKSRLIVRPA